MNEAFYRPGPNFIARTIVGETVLVPVGDQARKMNGFATFSQSGQVLWDLLAQGCTGETLVAALLDRYDCTEAQARADVREFLEKMLAAGMIERA